MAARFAQWVILRRALLLLLAARLALGVAYSLSLPLWEADNEDGHFAYAHYLAVHRSLLRPDDPEAMSVWEKFQPPLYYLVLAPVIAGFDLGLTFAPPERNPYLGYGNAGVNYALHPAQLSFAETQIARAVLAGRLFGVALSTLSVLAVYWAARRLWPAAAGRAWAATCLYAFWPQFLFTGSMVTNDVLVTALAALGFALMVELVTQSFRLRWVLMLGAVLSAALVTKLTAFALIPGALLAVGLSLIASRRPWTRRGGLALVALLVLMAGAVWFLSSLEFVTAQVLHSETLLDFLRAAPNVAETTGQTGVNLAAGALNYGFRTFLASYGWGNLEAYPWLYPLWEAGAALAVAGLMRAAWRRAWPMAPKLLVLLGVQTLSPVALALALSVAQQNVYVPGRYYLPALPAIACLLISGWQELLPARWQPWAWKGISIGLVVVGWSIPFTILIPNYAVPRALTGPVAAPLNLRFGEAIELLGHQPLTPLTPGQRATFTLCWRATAPISHNYSVFIEVVGSDGQGYGRLVTYPGRGNYATSLWEVGRAFCDDYALSVGANLPAPSAAEVQVSLLTTTDANGERLPVIAAVNNALASFASIPIKVSGGASTVAALSYPTDIRFGDVIRLRGYEVQSQPDPQRRVRVTFQWEALKDPSADYTAFVHLRDTPETAYAQSDGVAQNGRYPTAWWTAGEVVLDPRTFTLPDYAPPLLDLYVGWLDADGNRLPAFDAQGQPLPNDEALLERGLRFAFPTPAPTPVYTDFIFLPMIKGNQTPPDSTPYP